jgi:hypothetical protein
MHEIVDWPDLTDPVLVVALEGWIDAGFAVASASAHLQLVLEPQTVATFDTEILIDYRARRPVLHLEDGVNTGLTWPSLELRAGRDLLGRGVLLLTGPEPDARWRAFGDEIVSLAHQLGVTSMVGLGAYPAAVPHTRTCRLSVSAWSAEMAAEVADVRSTVDAPAGAQAVIERRFTDFGVPNLTLWAQVPHYASGMAYPPASVALLRKTCQVGGLDLDLSGLETAASGVGTHLDELVGANPEHVAMVHQLELQYDDEARSAPLPSADQLGDEIERYLREVGRGDSSG